MCEDITTLHIAASYLDPSLKGFSFAKDTGEWQNLTEQEADIVKKNAITAVKFHVYPTKVYLRIVMLRYLRIMGRKEKQQLNLPIRGQNMNHWLNIEMLLLIVNQGRSQAI